MSIQAQECGETGSYRDLQVGWGTTAKLKVTHTNIIGQYTQQPYSLETQLCQCCGYQL